MMPRVSLNNLTQSQLLNTENVQRMERSGSSIHSLIKLSRYTLKSSWKEADGRLLIPSSFTHQPPRRMFRSNQ